jgi:transposase
MNVGFHHRRIHPQLPSPRHPSLLRQFHHPLGVRWDGLPGHRSRATWEFIREQRGRLWVEFLPGYAPELNPVEYLWSQQLSHYARQALRRMRKRPTLVIAFWQQAKLFPL